MLNLSRHRYVIFFSLVLVIMITGGCGGGGSTSPSTTTIYVNTAPSPTAGFVQLSGTIQPDPNDATAAGSQSGATVYAMGQQNNAVKTSNTGTYALYINPQLSGTVLASPKLTSRLKAQTISRVAMGTTTMTYNIVVVDSNDSHGRTIPVQIVTNQSNTAPTIYINQVGSITGHAYLQGATDHSGITVYIPGTSFSAITDANGAYTITGVPSGTYTVLRAEKFGTTYHFAILSNITVNTNQQTSVADMLLQLSTGPFGGVLINNGAAFTSSRAVTLSIATSNDAILMSVSSDPNFVGAAWEPVQATKLFTFPGTYANGGSTATVYVKFAQESGLASSPITSSIYIDTSPAATMVGPVSVTMSQTPTLDWDYSPPMPSPTYRVQLANNSSFTSPIVDVNNLSASQYIVPTTLSQGTYYWRVAIIYNSSELSSGPTWTFNVDRTAGTLQSPANLSKINNTTPQFTWIANPSASRYDFALSLYPDLSNPVNTQSNITGNSWGPIVALSGTASSVYYWAVTPRDSLGVAGTQSGIWYFTLDTVAPSGSITINNNDTFTAVTSVTLNLAATDANKVAAYLVSENPATPSSNDTRWVAVTPTASLGANPTFTLSSGSGVKTVYAWFKDAVGNISSSYSDSINLIDFTPNMQTIDQGGNGGFPSIALAYTPGATANIVYIDEMNNAGIKFLTDYTHSWSWPTSLDTDPLVNSGADHSIATHYGTYDWTLHVVYSDGYNYTYYLHKPAIMRAAWSPKSIVDSAPNSLSFNLPSVAVDSNNKAHIAYVGNDYLKYANNIAGSWATYTIDSGAKIYGQSLSIGVDSNNKVYISYLDSTNKTVKCISNATGTWVPKIIDPVGTSYGNTSLAIGNANSVHIAYNAWSTTSNIKYATNSLGSWTTTTVGFGDTLSLAVDTASNAAYISYEGIASIPDPGLKLATNVFGPWAIASVDSSVSPINTSIAVNGSILPHSIHMVYFNQKDWSLRYTFANY